MELLEYHRIRHGDTQRKAARRIRVSHGAWNKWESGSIPAPSFLPRIARYCGMSMEQFIGELMPDAAKFTDKSRNQYHAA